MNLPDTAMFESVLAHLLRASWQAAILALIVLGVTLLCGKWLDARIRFGLWLVVLARLALPIVPAAPWSLFAPLSDLEGTIRGPVAATPSIAEPAAPAVSPRQDREAVAMPDAATADAAAPPGPLARPPAAARAASARPPLPWTAVVGMAWAAGTMLLLARQAYCAIWLARQRRRWAHAVDLATAHLFDACRRELPLRRSVELRVSADVGPATCGVLRPLVVIPRGLVRALSPEDLRLVFLHELVHVRRLDFLFDRLASLVAAVHWFNPFAWLALARLRRERELACDAALIDRIGAAAAKRYGRTLLDTLAVLSAGPRVSTAVGMGGARAKRSIRRRVRMIAAYRPASRWRTLAGAAAVALLLATGLTDSRGEGKPASQVDPKTADAAEPGIPAFTIQGVCRDEENKPLRGVTVALYRHTSDSKWNRIAAVKTNSAGAFELDVPENDLARNLYYAVAATPAGRASQVYPVYEPLHSPLALRMPPAATLRGRVTNEADQPVGGASVWLHCLGDPLDNVQTATTDAAGNYVIRDLAAWDVAKQTPLRGPNGTTVMLGNGRFFVRHPDYAFARPALDRIPDTIDVQLVAGAVLEGRVLDDVTGKPPGRMTVCAQQVPHGDTFFETATDANGHYRFASLPEAKFNIWIYAPDRTCVALDSQPATAGKTAALPDLHAIEGSWLEGRVVSTDGQPMTRGARGETIYIGLHGPARPKSGAAVQSTTVDERGRFAFRAPPGINYPYLQNADLQERLADRAEIESGIEVRSGEDVSLELRVLPVKPQKLSKFTPVRFVVPVPEERAAAKAIRDLGGWYEVDGDGHVVEVNMVYYEPSDEVRFENDRVDTDAALRQVTAFPRLRALFLKEGQATDEALAATAGLERLKTLMVWDAKHLTDAGIRHLAGLKNLRDLHFNRGQLSDGALEVFGGLPNLDTLSLQGNRFSDEGLKHLAGLQNLHSLWIGMGNPYTDAGVRHLLGLKSLHVLEMQSSKISPEMLAELERMPALNQLYVNDLWLRRNKSGEWEDKTER